MSMTTAQLEADALTVPCPEHHVTEGTACPHRGGEERESPVCLTRRGLAAVRRLLAEFPSSDDMDGVTWGELRQLAWLARDAAQEASNCVDIALAPFGVA
jgi:hypothetical protein